MAKQYENQVKYWKNGLQRAVAIELLAEQGLVMHVDGEFVEFSKNRSFLSILEVILQFDFFLEEHIDTHGNRGRGKLSCNHTQYF
jgi:hypothetical protein